MSTFMNCNLLGNYFNICEVLRVLNNNNMNDFAFVILDANLSATSNSFVIITGMPRGNSEQL